jgi:NlpC/P60 family putative phage cell wall peptidase
MSEVVRAARGWIGTPYCHQAATRGAGCDCLGLIRGVWRELRGAEPALVPPYAADWAEASGQERLWDAARTHLTAKPLAARAPGDVLLFRMRERGVAKHLGILATDGAAPTFLHAYSRHGVIESPFTKGWQRRLVACFAFE